MVRFLKFSFAGFLMALLLSFPVYADNGDPMYNFYNGLANVIESNMDNPEACVAKAESYIRKNIGPLERATQRGRRMAETGMYDDMTEEDAMQALEGMGEAMSRTGGFQALNRFQRVLGVFEQKYPEHAERLLDSMSEHQSQFE